ncbi:hypothetical protein BST22_05760 [Mycolicibacterium chubuense]|uniref:hypothetical protein n=1 Tax=Mycolicibacterium chubuense TaxID=1800 RepID=UPI0009F5961A|nr:hypothetical protein [Mycolicibacterium chubuense]ORA54900.1 hypothetical protein BST22_05760 [Mycolicibacterium chubuense]SPX97587.1 Uncharacterised protein [Mycolicibacterium chubuense]
MTAALNSRLNTSTDSLLRFAMRADAVLSGLTGIGLLIFAPRVAELSGTTATFEYATGAFFVVFSLAVLVLASRPAIRTSGLVLAVGNLLFTVATVILVLSDVFPLTTTGVVLVLGTGVYTLVMAELQYQGVRRI